MERPQPGVSMSPTPEEQWRPPEPPNRQQRPGGPQRPMTPRSRWLPWVVIGVIVIAVLVWQTAPSGSTDSAKLEYSQFLSQVKRGTVDQIKYDSSTGKISGEFKP